MFFCLILSLLACNGNESNDIEINSFKGSDLNNDFPIPEKAERVTEIYFEAHEEQIKKNYIYYRFVGIGSVENEFIPEKYFAEIERWGWNQLDNKSIGQ